MTEPGVLPAPVAGAGEFQATLAPRQPLFPGGLRAPRPASRLLPEPVPVADGETAIELPAPAPVAPPVVDPGPRLGPAWPVAETQVEVSAGPVNIYSHTVKNELSPAVVGVPLRVYVPNSDAASVSVIDPTTMKVVDRFAVGTRPHHVTPVVGPHQALRQQHRGQHPHRDRPEDRAADARTSPSPTPTTCTSRPTAPRPSSSRSGSCASTSTTLPTGRSSRASASPGPASTTPTSPPTAGTSSPAPSSAARSSRSTPRRWPSSAGPRSARCRLT